MRGTLQLRGAGGVLGLLALVLISGCSGNDCCGPNGLLTIQLAPTNSGDGQTDTIGGTLANSLRVLVQRDQRPVKGVVVSWTTLSGSVSPLSSATDASGLAQAMWTLGDSVGAWSATASLPNETAVSDTVPLHVSFSVIVRPGAPVALVFRPGPSNAFVGRPLIPVVQVAALDRRGNVATDFHGSVTVALAADPGGASLTGKTTVDAVDGIASFANLSLDRVGAGYTLTASAGALLGVTSAAFEIVAPGSGQIAFWSNSDIYVMSADGSGSVNLTNNPSTSSEFAWSPNGSQIAFTTGRDGNWEIYVMNADGSGLRNLTKQPTADVFGAWSPDGSKIAFYSDRDGGPGLFIMNADGSGPTPLTMGGAWPAWSPDGSKIVFVGGEDYIEVISADGSGSARLTNGPDFRPAWSPDGKQIAFVRDFSICGFRGGCTRVGPVFLNVMNVDGSGLASITSGSSGSRCQLQFAWAPDGSRIVFSCYSREYAGIYVLNADGSGIVQLPGGGSRPTWSPDGSRIAFSNYDIYVVNPDGSGLVDLHAAGSNPSWKP